LISSAKANQSDFKLAQQDEVLRRRAEYLANPPLAIAWDDGFFDRLRERLADARPQKAARR
jgi:hypothetical protein